MKRLLPLFLFLALLLPFVTHAQENSTDIDRMEVSLWPDYDDASLLVLMTAAMPVNAILPADITIPLPDGYDQDRLIIARITEDGNMIDDLQVVKTANSVSFSMPENRFRIEYYVPYSANGDDRQIEFSWLSPDLNVASFQVAVQEPAMATEITTSPEPIGELSGGTGLTEYLLPEVSLPAGTSYEAMADYVVNGRLLSIDILNDDTQPTTNNGITVESDADNNNTLIILFGVTGVLLIGVAVGWYIYSSRQNSKPPQKPKPTRATQVRSKKTRTKATKFCHECGSPLTAGAKFCASCGTAVKK